MIIHKTADLGRIIRDRRQQAGMTAAQAAELAGVSRRLWTELELGKRHQAGLGTVLRILETLGLGIDVEPRGLPGTRSPAKRDT
jgi:transcriptional regulator with XRE-family HTH domain